MSPRPEHAIPEPDSAIPAPSEDRRKTFATRRRSRGASGARTLGPHVSRSLTERATVTTARGPRDRLEPARIDHLAAPLAQAVGAVVEPRERVLDRLRLPRLDPTQPLESC